MRAREDTPETTVIFDYAYPNSNITIPPGGNIDVLTMTFQAPKIGTFEIRCNGIQESVSDSSHHTHESPRPMEWIPQRG
jgi:hypothetical protein